MNPASEPLLVFGSINQDIVLSVAQFPEPGQTLMASGTQTAIGGKGANQAIAAALAGAQTRMVGAVGHDGGGAEALEALEAAGVGTDLVQRPSEVPTGTAYICVRGDGENTIVADPGANHAVRAQAADRALTARDSVPDAGWVLLSLEAPEQEAFAFAAAARARGMRVALNASPLLQDGLPDGAVDLLIVNEVEAAAVAGSGWAQSPNLADQLSMEAVVVTQGGAGVRLDVRGAQSVHIPAIPVTVRDTTGCGDAFAGVLMSRLCRGEPLPEAAAAAARWAGHVAEFDGASASYRQAFAQAAGRGPES